MTVTMVTWENGNWNYIPDTISLKLINNHHWYFDGF